MGRSNPYRGWTLVERTGGVYMTRDNLHYARVGDAEFDRDALKFSYRTMDRFHRMVDEREDG